MGPPVGEIRVQAPSVYGSGHRLWQEAARAGGRRVLFRWHRCIEQKLGLRCRSGQRGRGPRPGPCMTLHDHAKLRCHSRRLRTEAPGSGWHCGLAGQREGTRGAGARAVPAHAPSHAA